MAVVTISRKLGSMGTYVGKKLAQRIGYDYVDKHGLAQIMKEYGFSKFDSVYETMPTLKDYFDQYRDSTIRFLATVIMAVAQHDNVVIAGRGSFGLLHDYSDVVNVRITASEQCRINRVMESRDITEADARSLVLQNDLIRRSFVESDFRFNYANTKDFNLLFDTGLVHPDLCVDWLEQVLSKNWMCETERKGPSIKSIEVEPVLQGHVKEMLALLQPQDLEIPYQIEQC